MLTNASGTELLNVNRAAETLLGLVLESQTTDPLQAVVPAVRTVLENCRTLRFTNHEFEQT